MMDNTALAEEDDLSILGITAVDQRTVERNVQEKVSFSLY